MLGYVSMISNYRIAQTADLDSIYDFAFQRLKSENDQIVEIELMMKVWESRFRKESLEHYLKLGWSFVGHNPETQLLTGFFIAQPLLFYQGHTQSLWVEYLLAENILVENQLLEITYKLARDKHFQRVLFDQHLQLKLENLNQRVQINEPVVWVKTTK
jgi:hypothetical protein